MSPFSLPNWYFIISTIILFPITFYSVGTVESSNNSSAYRHSSQLNNKNKDSSRDYTSINNSPTADYIQEKIEQKDTGQGRSNSYSHGSFDKPNSSNKNKGRNYSRTRSSSKSSPSSNKSKKNIDEGGDGSRQKMKEEIQKKLNSIRSDLGKVDSIATNAEFQQASQLLDEINSRFTKLQQEAHKEDFDTRKTDMQRLEQECDSRLSKPHVLSQLRGMDPYEFEELVAKIWRKQGWNAEATSGSADRGVDVVATKQDAFETRRHLIQVKRHGENSTVGSEDIQRYASLYQRDEQVDNVFIVTSNRFTAEAMEVAKRRGVSTVGGDELYEMLTET
jgi:restriction endonuclease Mrr